MKVSPEKIKARRAQFQNEGVKVPDALELNAGVREFRPATVQAKPGSSTIGSRKPNQSGKQHAAPLWKTR